jgi:hypothetical protein
VNSEELELSLRSEFENYLKTFRAELRQEAEELQKRFAEAFDAYASRLDSEQRLDEGFSSLVTEHLRLARDEGAKLTATALAEAEQLASSEKAVADHGSLREAVAEISSQTSQSAILQSLVGHAAAFAPRGAFFIIKSEQFSGWKAFGAGEAAEAAVTGINFAVSADTILGRAVQSLANVDSAFGAHRDDQSFLEPLQFGHPDHMYAVPLVARGRGVAVLYADHGAADGRVDLDALETLVRVAALTVELLAASHTARSEGREQAAADFETASDEAPMTHPVPEVETTSQDFAFSDGGPETPVEAAPAYFEEPTVEEHQPQFEEAEQEVPHQFEAPEIAPEAEAFEPEPAPLEASNGGYGDVNVEAAEPPAPAIETSHAPAEAAHEGEPAAAGFVPVMPDHGVVVAPPAAGRPRLSDRNVDLPIDVAEEERRLHNDARRFARLLVSEIKLYNEKKVMEGRQANDLYERLREAIDRSREMYDKRVQPPVASKFDYFHYELVNALADGNPESLGTSYPGANI